MALSWAQIADLDFSPRPKQKLSPWLDLAPAPPPPPVVNQRTMETAAAAKPLPAPAPPPPPVVNQRTMETAAAPAPAPKPAPVVPIIPIVNQRSLETVANSFIKTPVAPLPAPAPAPVAPPPPIVNQRTMETAAAAKPLPAPKAPATPPIVNQRTMETAAAAAAKPTAPTNKVPPVVIPYVSQGIGVPVDKKGFPTSTQAALEKSKAANPGSTFGPSPNVDYAGINKALGLDTLPGGAAAAAAAAVVPAPDKPAAPYDPTIDYLMGQRDSDLQKRRSARDDAVRRHLLAFGSREMARKLFGDSDPFVQSVSDDPSVSDSWLAQAKRRLQMTMRDTSEMLGHQFGLWNSSGRTQALSDIGRDYQTQLANQTSQVQDTITGLDQAIVDAERDWMQRLFEARRAAWQAGASNHGF